MPRVKLFDEQEILEKAMELFWKKGYYATSIQDLVDHLGVNRASLYDTYGGKKELFYKAFQYYRATNTQALRKFLNNHNDIKEGFRSLFRLAIEESKQDKDLKGCFVVNTTTELVPNDSNAHQVLCENKSTLEQLFYDYLSSGVQKGQISEQKDLKAIVSILFTYYSGLRIITKVNIEEQELYSSVDTLLSLLD
ncbi:MAG: TetR/AcrR family transcriptional regulator [Chitinophagales bacterium]|nr:TetR/AcrR family transcriptional regulator [Chitinophagales bacterium]